MTPHRQWMRKYTSMRIPIKLADDTIVYSAGVVGTVVFNPVVYGKESRSHFKRAGQTLFTATVTSQHTGILNGATEPLLECAGAAATIPFDINPWHRRLGHHSYADVQKMIKDGLVVGLHLDSKEQPDPICEPCLAGKMTANPFPVRIVI
jgi:hypothetical protein